MRGLWAISLAFGVTAAVAQQDAEIFPQAAMSLLNKEMPAMEAAVANRDRDYFEEAMGRVLSFSETWGFKTQANPALARYRTCTEAVQDFLVVGLCRFQLSAETCQPTLASNFNANLQRCREQAR